MTKDKLGPDYDPKCYLWHLESIKLLTVVQSTVTLPPKVAEVWESQIDPTRVAIIDTGFCTTHENLPQSAQTARIDFSTHRFGTVYVDSPSSKTKLFSKHIKAKLLACDFTEAELNVGEPLGNLIEDGMNGDLTLLKVPDPAESFGSHATSCAGLVAGRPAKPTEEHTKGLINYFGVDPTAELISIATPYNHEIRPIIRALLYAVDQGAEVILMPRGVNPCEYRDPPDPTDPRLTRFDTDARLKKHHVMFERVLDAISTKIPVIVAAGNDGRDTLAYPARLVVPESTPSAATAADMIVAGAHTARNLRSAYSSGTFATGVTVYCPSDDAQVLDENLLRVDLRSFTDSLDPASNNSRPNSYSPFGVLALDIPGRFGRSEGSGEDDDAGTDRPGRTSRYSIFGGTSAASSILAGLVSLMQRAAKAGAKQRSLTGGEVKKILKAHQNTEMLQPGEGLKITPLDAVGILTAASV